MLTFARLIIILGRFTDDGNMVGDNETRMEFYPAFITVDASDEEVKVGGSDTAEDNLF